MATEVTIRILNASESIAPAADAEPEETPEPEVPEERKGKPKNKKARYAISQATQFTKKIVADADYYFGKYMNATENYNASTALQNAKTSISVAMSVAGSSIGGAMTGAAAAGPAGAAVGAFLGFMNGLMSQFSNALKTNYDARVELLQNAYDNYFYGRRAGYVTGGYGTEN